MSAAAATHTWAMSPVQLYTGCLTRSSEFKNLSSVRRGRDTERGSFGMRESERHGDPHQVYLSVRYTYRMSQIPYSVGVVLPKTLRTALSRSESVV